LLLSSCRKGPCAASRSSTRTSRTRCRPTTKAATPFEELKASVPHGRLLKVTAVPWCSRQARHARRAESSQPGRRAYRRRPCRHLHLLDGSARHPRAFRTQNEPANVIRPRPARLSPVGGAGPSLTEPENRARRHTAVKKSRWFRLCVTAMVVAGSTMGAGCARAPMARIRTTPPAAGHVPIIRPVSIDRTGRILQVPVEVGGCQRSTVSTVQTSHVVTLTATEKTHEPPAGTKCPAVVGFLPVKLSLDKPLADRRLRDGATGKFLPPPTHASARQ
jgi:hypothetical protein